MLEHAAEMEAETVGTDRMNSWLPQIIGENMPKRNISEMNFSSPAARLTKFNKIDQNGKYPK